MVQSIRESSAKYETQDSQSTTTIFPHSSPLSTLPFIIGRSAKGPRNQFSLHQASTEEFVERSNLTERIQPHSSSVSRVSQSRLWRVTNDRLTRIDARPALNEVTSQQ